MMKIEDDDHCESCIVYCMYLSFYFCVCYQPTAEGERVHLFWRF